MTLVDPPSPEPLNEREQRHLVVFRQASVAEQQIIEAFAQYILELHPGARESAQIVQLVRRK